jgi:hypothetical protein
MIKRIKLTGLTLGLFSTIISFIFFACLHSTYTFLLTAGFLITIIFFLSILFGKGSLKYKLLCTLLLISGIITQRLTEAILIKTSCLIYLDKSKSELNALNAILKHKSGELFITQNNILDKGNTLTLSDRIKIESLRKKARLTTISTSEDKIYYELFGFLDARFGIFCLAKIEKANTEYRHLKDNWYY